MLQVKYQAKQRIEKQARERQEAEAAAEAALLERAIKRANIIGIKRGVITPLDISPQQEINLLEKYVDDLRALSEELIDTYGRDGRDGISWVRLELHKAIEMIARRKIDLVKPGE